MGFTIDARVILELGRELISSDEIAIYELIKNSVDAGSPSVQIDFRYLLNMENYKESLDLFEKTKNLKKVSNFIHTCITDEIDPNGKRFLNKLKKESNPEQFSFLLRKSYAELNHISVIDIGHGMSLNDLQEVYLRIGTRFRREQTNDGDPKLGDKGIGRLSAMRLGNELQIKSTRSIDENWNCLNIDWNAFDCEENKDIDEIMIEPHVGEMKQTKSNQGTIIQIKDLRKEWNVDEVQNILDQKISRFIDPFRTRQESNVLSFSFNGLPVIIPRIKEGLLERAHAHCEAEFEFLND